MKLLYIVALLVSVPMTSQAYDSQSGKLFALGVIGGFPQTLGIDLSYLGWSPVTLGISFGSAPVQSVLHSKVNLTPIPIDFSLPDQYTLLPSANYKFYSVSAYLKYFFPDSAFFLEFLVSNLTFGADVTGNLQNDTTKRVSYDAIGGSASLSQPIIGIATGFRTTLASSFFIEGAIGGGYLLPPSYLFSIGGTVSNIIGVVPNGEETFDQAKSQVRSSFDSAMQIYRSSVKIVPFAFISTGIVF